MYYVTAAGAKIESRDMYAMLDGARESGHRFTWHASPGRSADGAYRSPQGEWHWPEDWSEQDRAQVTARHEQATWWEDHKRDVTVIPGLSDSDLIHFRLLADIRADIPVLSAAERELHRRGIRDYPIAV